MAAASRPPSCEPSNLRSSRAFPAGPIPAYGRGMRRSVSLVLAGALLLLSSSCGDSARWDDDCTHGTCVCRDLDSCDFVCREPGCRVDCGRSSSCGGQCVDHCTFGCSDTSSCALTCGDDCAVTCGRTSACDVACLHGCHVTCSDVSSCRVTLVEGSVVCERAGHCEVTCAAPGATPVPARDCGGARFVCGPC